MSFILDALRKSERERQTGQAPGLPQLMTETPKPPSRGWYAAIVVLLAVNLAVIAWWLLARQERVSHAPEPVSAPAPQGASAPASAVDQPASTAIANPATSPPASAQPVVPSPIIAPAVPAPSAMPMAGAVPAAPIPATPAAPTPMPPPAPANRSAARQPAAEPRRPSVEEAPPGMTTRERPYPGPRHRSAPAPLVPADDDEEAAGMDRDDEPGRMAQAPASGSTSVTVRPWPVVRPGTPDLRDLPLDFQERIPPLKISMFAYSREPSERFVIIDMKKYRTGDRLPGNLLLLEIQAENLLLELDGQKFRAPRF